MRARIAAGMSDEEIRQELDLTVGGLEKLKRIVIQEDLVLLRHRPAEETFIEYRIRLGRIANDLLDVSLEARECKQFNAAMGALKAEATIVDKVIDRGQELGIFPRAPKSQTHTVVGGLVIGTMTDRELADSLKASKGERSRLREKYGDTTFAALPDPDIYPDVVEAVPAEPVPAGPVAPVRRRSA